MSVADRLQKKARFEKIVKGVKRSGSAENPWAVANATMSRLRKKAGGKDSRK